MVLDLFQRNKERFSADFEVIDRMSLDKFGQLHYENKKGMNELNGEWSGTLFGRSISIPFESKSAIDSERNNSYRPCPIIIDGLEKGGICQRSAKTGWFTTYSFHEMEYKGNPYVMYPISFGKDGAKNPVYSRDAQIAQIEKSSEIIDDMHNFSIFSLDDVGAMVCTLFSCYMYTVAFYKHGIEVSHSKQRYYSKTTNKTLLSKYNPKFKSDNFIY